MKDIGQNLTEEEQDTTHKGRLCKAEFNKLFYADDTLVITTTTEAAQLILLKIQEPVHYNIKLEQ